MKMKKFKPFIVSIIIAIGVGALGGIITSKGMPAYDQLIKPGLTPPPSAFPIAWSILYILMGISAAMIWQSTSAKRDSALSIYAIQLAFNAIWSFLFFGFQAYLFSFIWLVLLWLMVLIMIIKFYQIRPIAGLIQIPYLLWLTFAGYLNFMIWHLNK